MPALEIPCPKCGKYLKVPDRNLLGRKARCGKCHHIFQIIEPATKTVAATGANSNSPHEEPPFDAVELAELFRPSSIVTTRAGLRKRGTRRWRNGLIAAAVTLLVAGGVGAYVSSQRSGRGDTADTDGKSNPHATATTAASSAKKSTAEKHPLSQSPTKGEPISLKMVPMGARVVIHLRPAELWEPGSAGEELRACLGPLGVWLAQQIETRCLLPPARIEAVVFALIPVSREAFDVSIVVRTRQPVRKSELIEKFDGELIDEPRPHYLGKTNAFLIHDAKTYAIAPRSMAESLLESVNTASVTSEGIQALLSRTDRDRHFTIVAELEDVRTGAGTLAPENAQNLLGAVVDFLGDDAETVAWSMHLGDPEADRDLFAELLVRNRTTHSPTNLQRDLKKNLAAMPAKVLKVVNQTNPRRLGEKQIVDRLPIMAKVVEQSAAVETDKRLVKVQWNLPERAAPNLALGTLLTWNQTTLPEFGTSPSSQPSSRSDLPATIAARLQKRIDVEFREKDPLYGCVEYISGEIGVEFKLDGPGMKRVGVTQNQPPKFSMQGATASTVLHRMLVPIRLVLIVDEQKKIATITSDEEAEDKKLKPFPLTPPPK
ncbi:MAG: hypothetical protein EXS05_18940 [Planctomycetaceae bacterium]|nr:hypothetical protein [Planctomycetaceae bacterium]